MDTNESINEYIKNLEERLHALKGITPRIVDNFDALHAELEETENSVDMFEMQIDELQNSLLVERSSISRLIEVRNAITNDLRNNKDALKLKNMGSELNLSSYMGICPICRQAIEDSLLPSQTFDHVMSIEENIKHLNSQESMISFAINAHQKNSDGIETNIKVLSSQIFTLRRLAKTIRNDLYTVDDNLSETVIYKRVHIEQKIQALATLKESVDSRLMSMYKLSVEWKSLLQDRATLPKTKFSKNDELKLGALEHYFKKYLQSFKYKSASDYSKIAISRDNYLPISEGFDMKFDSSASDNIRAIWAYTLAMLHTSIEHGGNHPQLLIFDEPGQHRIVADDMISFFNAIVEMPGNVQVIVGITLGDVDIRNAVEKIEKEKIRIIDVGTHSFSKLS